MFQPLLTRAFARRVHTSFFAARTIPVPVRSLYTRNTLLFPAATSTLNAAPVKKAGAVRKLSASKKVSASTATATTPTTKEPTAKKASKKIASKPKPKPKVAKKKAGPPKEYTPPPKRPQSAFLLYSTQQRPEKIEQEGLLKFSKRAGEQWRQLSQVEKQPYLDEAAALKVRWSEEYISWKNGLSRKGWVQYRRALRKRLRGRAPRDVDTGEPIPRVPSAYNLFVQETYPKIRADNPTADRKEHFKLTIETWNSLNDSEKAIWQARHAELVPQNLEAREKAKKKRVADFKARHPKIEL